LVFLGGSRCVLEIRTRMVYVVLHFTGTEREP
jgi:hypothetical protein